MAMSVPTQATDVVNTDGTGKSCENIYIYTVYRLFDSINTYEKNNPVAQTFSVVCPNVYAM